jgi:D-glycero-D-manno-heptose 1,7-bisphosphate phosphatase
VLIEDSGYPHREDQLKFIPGAADAVRRLNAMGYLAVVVTNQSGVARGMFTEAQMNSFNALMVRRLAARGARIAQVYSCPFHDEARDPAYHHPDHPDRKPNPGMLLRAMADHNIDPAKAFIIGDQPRDLEAGRRAGVTGFLFEGGDLDDFVAELLGV